MKKFVIILLVVIVGLVIFAIVKTDKIRQDAEGMPVEGAGGASGQFARLEENAIYVPDQKPGDEVIVKILNNKDAGFVVIHKDASGSPGAIVGVSEWLTSGEHADIDIGITESMMDGLVYYAMIHKDDGNGIFDPKSDSPVYSGVNVSEPMMMMFNVSKDAPDPKNIQVNF